MSGRADVQIGGQLLLPSCYHPADTTEEKNIEMQARQAGTHSTSMARFMPCSKHGTSRQRCSMQ